LTLTLKRRAQRAFTFIEVMLVVLIMGLAMAIAMPDFRSLGDSTQLEGQSRRLVGILRQARARAISINQYMVVEFHFDAEEGHKVYMFDEETDRIGDKKRRSSRRKDEVDPSLVLSLPREVTFASWDTAEKFSSVIFDGGRKARIYFYPNGTAIPATMSLVQSRDARSGEGKRYRYYTVEVLRTTGLAVSHPGQPNEETEDAPGYGSEVKPLAGRRSEDLQRYLRVIEGGND